MRRSHRNTVAKDEIGLAIAAPYWSEDEICSMDIKFADAMMNVIAVGIERCAIGVNTSAGTRFPIPNYRRPD